MKIGLPRALMYYYYFPLWKKLFEELGFEVVVSDATTGKALSEGIKVTVSELCVPIKIFNSHLINLLEKGVDYCFVPRFVKTGGREWYCPKFLGLTPIVKYSIPNIQDKILSVDIEGKGDSAVDIKNYYQLCDVLSIEKNDLHRVFEIAKKHYDEFQELLKQGYAIDEAEILLQGGKIDEEYKKAPITIGVLGYVYNVYDRFVSMDILNRLRKANINIATFEMEDDLENKKEHKEKPLFWTFSRQIYNASKKILKKVDGIIHVTAFACGPDSVIGKMMEMDCEEEGVPFMTIRVDEHSGENHIQTRIEAFCDMLTRKQVIGSR